MGLSNIYIYALNDLDGFNEETIEIAINLADNDVVETVDEYIDFINFNIEEKKFPGITNTFPEKSIRKAVENAQKNESKIGHVIHVSEPGYPSRLYQARVNNLASLVYKGNLENLERKTIMITGSTAITTNAKVAAKYFGKLFASKGYNILSSFAEGCEQNAIYGCTEARGISTFFLPHSIESLTAKEKRTIQNELETGRSTLISLSSAPNKANEDSIAKSYGYLSALADCLIVPQISYDDEIMFLVRMFLASNKPVFLISYKSMDGDEYDCDYVLKNLGAKFLSSDSALKLVRDAIGAEKTWMF